MRRLRFLLVLLAASSLFSWSLPSVPASAAPAAAGPAAQVADPAATGTINVTATADEWDDPSNPASANTQCSLREALQLAYTPNEKRGCKTSDPNATTINIVLQATTYNLTREENLPDIGANKVINVSGPGGDPGAVIDGGSQGPARHYGIFHVVNGALNLKNVTLQHGSRPGGGALWQVGGTVTADHVVFENNDAAADQTLNQNGGAILTSSGDITVTNSWFENNVAVGYGGAVSTAYGYFFHDFFIDNRAAGGGGFDVSAPTTFPVIVDQSKFQGNLARPTPFETPGAGYQPYSDTYGGGAIVNYGNLQVFRSLLQENHTELTKGGGGVDNHGTMLMSECVLTKNSAAAAGSGDNNGHITAAFGGAIINYNTLDLVRCSVHGNEADYAGAILNHGVGILSLYNSTVSNNTAHKFYGGLANDLPDALYGNSSIAAEIHLVQTTVGKNDAAGAVGLLGNELWQQYAESVFLGNAIVVTGCNLPVYTEGGSVTSDFCQSVPDPLTPAAGPVLSMSATINLQPLQPGNAAVPLFMVQHIAGSSSAAGIGVDDQYTCNNSFIQRRDQNLAPRPPGGCAAGAIQTTSAPPQFNSMPGPGLVTFPLVDLQAGPPQQQTTVMIKNTGGGAMTYYVHNEDLTPLGGSYKVNLLSASTGTLYAGQSAPLTFQCTPGVAGDHWERISIQTNAPNQKVASYKFRCTAVGLTRQASMSSPPGPYNLSPSGAIQGPQAPSSGTLTGTLALSNPGPTPLTVSYAWSDTNPMWGVSSQVFAALDQPALETPASPAVTLVTSQTLQLTLACTPPSNGMFVNTLVFTTNDPINPQIHYDVACEPTVDNPPEDMQAFPAYPNSTQMEGVAVSPNGATVLAGDYGDNQLHVYARSASTGQLNSLGVNTHQAGWAKIYGVGFSHDGQNAYFTSQDGNGIATLSASNLLAAPTIIDNSSYICHINPIHLCAITTLLGARGLAISPDDQFVYVAGYGDGSGANGGLTVFQRSLTDGSLAWTQSISRTIGGVNVLGGAARVAVSPDGQFVYVAAMVDNTVAVFERGSDGQLSFQAAYKQGSGGLTHLAVPTDLAVSPDGNFLYVAAEGSSAINTFSRSSADGGLSLTNVITSPQAGATWGVAVSPDVAGRRLFFANYGANIAQVDSRDPNTGAPGYINGYPGTDGPVFVGLSLDDLSIYMSQWSNSQPGKGGLLFFQTIENAPVLSHLSPASAAAGGGGFTLTAAGGRFYANSQIVWNGTALPTTFIDEHTLQASVAAGQVAAGSPNVLVRNPAPGGGDSGALPFAVVPPGQPLVPSIQSLDPPDADFGGGVDLTVLVQGANFAGDAVVYYNRQAVPTVFINDHTLQITLSTDILTAPGDGGLQVVNGGGAPTSASPLSGPDLAAASKRSTIVPFRVHAPGVTAGPTLKSLSPAAANIHAASVWIKVVGHNFSSDPAGLSVGRWNGVERPTVVLDANTLLMQITASDLPKVGSGRVTVLTPGAGETRPLIFHILSPRLYLPAVRR